MSVIVVNNDVTPDVPGLDSILATMPFPTRVLHEPQSGKSVALNSGIASSTADYIAFLDDDEEVSPTWLRILESVLETGDVDFVGGRTVALSSVTPPPWLPVGYRAVLGFADNGPDERQFGSTFPGLLIGGNAVISRTMLTQVGPYSPDLGPCSGRRLLSCEDEDMYWRLIDAGARGRYLPNLILYHHVHRDRLRKAYYREWCFWNGASKGVLSRRRPSTVPQIAGVPRYMFGAALRGLWALLRATLTRGPEQQRLAAELPSWQLAGRLYGRHVLGARRPTRSPDRKTKLANQRAATL